MVKRRPSIAATRAARATAAGRGGPAARRRQGRRPGALAWLCCCCLLPAALPQQPSGEARGRQIIEEAERRHQGFGDLQAEVAMTLRSRQGSESRRSLRLQILERPGEGDRTLVIVESPPDVRGTALLTFSHARQPDDRWLFLPALQRVKRISSSNQSGPFLGSEFAYEDIAPQEIDQFRYRYLGDEPCEGRSCFVVERTPLYRDSGYTRHLAWIDRQEYRVWRIDYYDRANTLLKTLTFDDYQRYRGRYWRAGTMRMVNHQSGKSTLLTWTNYRFGTGLREEDLHPSRLRSVR